MTLLHPLLAQRWSPTVFDGEATLGEEEVGVLLEAARWAPSAGNSQPWAFITALRGAADHARLVARLAPSARRWAASASLLVANLSHRTVEGSELEYSEFALYDLGQAVAHLSVQASAMGLYVRQFRAFDRAGVEADFAVTPDWQVSTMAAVGRVPAPRTDDAPAVRERRTPDELLWPAAAEAGRRP